MRRSAPVSFLLPQRLLLTLPLLLVVGVSLLALADAPKTVARASDGGATAGSLRIVRGGGVAAGAFCPLKHTGVKAEVSGFLSRVTVTQQFENTLAEKIEAVYTFPLPQAAAVDDMTLEVGARTTWPAAPSPMLSSPTATRAAVTSRSSFNRPSASRPKT